MYTMYMYAVNVCVRTYAHPTDRCWTAIAMDSNAYWTALPTGVRHRLLAGCNCKVWMPAKASTVTETQSHDKSTCTVVYRRTAPPPPSGALKGRKLMGGGYTIYCPISTEIPPRLLFTRVNAD